MDEEINAIVKNATWKITSRREKGHWLEMGIQRKGKKMHKQWSRDVVQFTVLYNQCRSISVSGAPKAQYLPALDPAKFLVVNVKLDILSYALKDFPVTAAISKLIVPGLLDQIVSMRAAFTEKLGIQHPQLSPYHFCPPGFLHPIAAMYDLRYGKTEATQVEIRKSLHERLVLLSDCHLLCITNALPFGIKGVADTNIKFSGGNISLVDGSYELSLPS